MIDKNLDSLLASELERIQYPQETWVDSSSSTYDVVIIGAGMAGLAAAFALKRLGISNLQIFDHAKAGKEGPWTTYARMPTLRSTKEWIGPSLSTPALTFRTWYESRFGKEQWNYLGKIPTALWMEYLCWFRKALKLPVKNNQHLKSIYPLDQGLELQINENKITTKKVVLATGRMGYGGPSYPSFIRDIPSRYYAHTNQIIDFAGLQDKKVGIIGAGASGFDAAAVALGNHASTVEILLRRTHLPYVNKAASITYSGFSEGFYHLSDEQRCLFMYTCYKDGSPPPHEALERIRNYPNFNLHRGVEIHAVSIRNNQVQLDTTQGKLTYDFLILATGFEIDGYKQQELSLFIEHIMHWKDRHVLTPFTKLEWFDRSPYLGPHFQFLEKTPNSASFLKNIYCFNYAATLSHGLLSGDIPGISVGAQRLAQGIASDLFTENWETYCQHLQNYQYPELPKDTIFFPSFSL